MKLDCTGSALVIRTLSRFGVKHIWGYPGGSVLNVYDGLYEHQDLQHLLTKTEQSAIFAATTTSRCNGSIGTCLVTSGPGITNSVTGITAAHSDSLPVLILSGQVPMKSLGKRSFQECDAIGLTKICTKRNFPITKVTSAKRTLIEAFYLLSNNKPSPVLLDFPKDVSKAVLLCCGLTKLVSKIHRNVTVRSLKDYERSKIRQLLLQLNTSSRPLLYIGGGSLTFGISRYIRQLISHLRVPVVSTLMGVSIKITPPALGMIGMHGQYSANLAMYYCDFLIAVGSRFDDRVISNIPSYNRVPRRTTLLNTDPAIRKGIPLDVMIRGELGSHLGRFLCILSKTPRFQSLRFARWLALTRDFQCHSKVSDLFNLRIFLRALRTSLTGRTIVSADVGQHQMLLAKHYDFGINDTWFSSGGLGAMGSSLPFVIGSSATNQYHNAICFSGDGSLLMSVNELLTAKQLDLGIVLVVLNNQSLGMVRQWQQVEYFGRYSHSENPTSTNFSNLAETYGAIGQDVSEVSHFRPLAIEAANQKNGVIVLTIFVSKDESVWPMIQAGKGITNMLLNHNDIS